MSIRVIVQFFLSTVTYHPISFIAAFDNVFEKFDLSGDGTISIEEYKTLCEEYGVNLTQEDIAAVRRITDDGGEVRENVGSLSSFLRSFIHQIHKDAFIRHLKQCNLLKDFQVADPESESYWKNRADLAFKYDLN